MKIKNKNVPKIAWITVNRACNLRCKWCYACSTGFSADSDIELSLAKKLAFLIKDIGIKTVILIGGEPTLWKHLFEFNDFCRELGLNTNLVTNGYSFRSKKFLDKFQQSPNTNVVPSLKAFDEQSSLLATGLRDFEGIKQGMRAIAEKSKAHTGIVYNSLIKGHLLQTVKMAVELGASTVRVSVCTPVLENDKFVSPFTVDFGEMVEEITGCYDEMMCLTKNELYFALNTPLCIWPKDFVGKIIERDQIGSGCEVFHRSGVVFDTDGTVILCNSMFNCPIGKFGEDFSDKEGLLTLLNSDRVNAVYDHVTAYPHELCAECDLYPRCRGGCPIMWTTHNAEEIISRAKIGK